MCLFLALCFGFAIDRFSLCPVVGFRAWVWAWVSGVVVAVRIVGFTFVWFWLGLITYDQFLALAFHSVDLRSVLDRVLRVQGSDCVLVSGCYRAALHHNPWLDR